MDTGCAMVTVSGLPGSGTTTACGLLKRELGWEHVNAGAVFRELAAEAGVGLVQFGLQAEHDASVDRALDARMVTTARELGQVILEGRLSGWMAFRHQLPALRCWLAAPVAVRAARVSQRDRSDLALATAEMRQREASEAHRYKAFHGIDYTDLSIYALTLSTEALSPEQIEAAIEERLKEPLCH